MTHSLVVERESYSVGFLDRRAVGNGIGEWGADFDDVCCTLDQFKMSVGVSLTSSSLFQTEENIRRILRTRISSCDIGDESRLFHLQSVPRGGADTVKIGGGGTYSALSFAALESFLDGIHGLYFLTGVQKAIDANWLLLER